MPRHVILRRVLAVSLFWALLAATLPGVVSAGTVPMLWGWVTARHPTTATYTPVAMDGANSVGGTNTVDRLGVGRYEVRFGGLDAVTGCSASNGCAGTALATAMSQTQRLCTVTELASGLPVTVSVTCRDRMGTLADSRFSVNFVAVRDDYAVAAYFYAEQPSNPNTYRPASEYNFNYYSPTNNAVERLGTGYYFVYLTDLHAGTTGNLQVAGVDARCRIEDRYDNNDPGDVYGAVYVRCRDAAENAADTTFFLSYTEGAGMKLIPGASAAYIFANKPTTGSYQPAVGFRYSSAGQAPTVTRSGVGAYTVKLMGLPLGGSAQVTAYGPGKSECQLSGIRTSGAPQRIGVLCFKPNGNRVDSKFYLTFTR